MFIELLKFFEILEQVCLSLDLKLLRELRVDLITILYQFFKMIVPGFSFQGSASDLLYNFFPFGAYLFYFLTNNNHLVRMVLTAICTEVSLSIIAIFRWHQTIEGSFKAWLANTVRHPLFLEIVSNLSFLMLCRGWLWDNLLLNLRLPLKFLIFFGLSFLTHLYYII